MADLGDKVSEGRQGCRAKDAIAEVKEAIESGDAAEITAKTTALAQAAMKLGEAMYKQAGGATMPAMRGDGAGSVQADATKTMCSTPTSKKSGTTTRSDCEPDPAPMSFSPTERGLGAGDWCSCSIQIMGLRDPHH